MNEEEKKKYLKIHPFDATSKDNFIIYDNAEYFPNRDNIANKINKSSGNVIKYYSAEVNKDAIKVGIPENDNN